MTGWTSSSRRTELPPDWPAIRTRILTRDGYRCTWITDGRRCQARATDVDHVGDKHDHRDENLRALCSECHKRRTQAQAKQAQAAQRAKARRPTEPHPGLR